MKAACIVRLPNGTLSEPIGKKDAPLKSLLMSAKKWSILSMHCSEGNGSTLKILASQKLKSFHSVKMNIEKIRCLKISLALPTFEIALPGN